MKKNVVNIALISPTKNAYSETFIQAHKELLKGNIFHYYGSFLPTHVEDKGLLQNSRPERILHILKGKFRLNKFSLDQSAILKSFKKNRIDVVFVEYGDRAERILPIVKQLNLPLIVHFHGYDASKKVILEKTNYYEELFEYAHSVVAVSQKMYKDILAWGCPESKLYYNPYGPNDEFFKVKPIFKKNQFLSVGRFVDKKAPYYLILSFLKLVEKHPDCSLIMAGDGELRETCKNLVVKLNLQANVKFVGILAPFEVRECLRESLCFLQHSITAENGDSEGTPVAILEASAAGLPVISTRHAGIPDVITDGETGYLLDEHDVDGFAQRMIKIINNPSEAFSMGKLGRKKIQENFSLSRHIDVINNLIEKAVLKD